MALVYSKVKIATDIIRLLAFKEPEAGIMRGALYVKLPFDILETLHRQICLTRPMAVDVETCKTKAESEKANITKAMAAYNGNRERAAKALGIGERTLYRKLKQYGINQKG